MESRTVGGGIQALAYAIGRSISCYDVRSEVALLDRHLPGSFRGRDVTDLGCGDGKVSLRLRDVLRPRRLRGIDASPQLVRAAVRRGLPAAVGDIETEPVGGDLGVLWGTVHHLRRPAATLAALRSRFDALLIREPVDPYRIFELGRRLGRAELLRLLAQGGIDVGQSLVVESRRTAALFVLVGR